MESKGKMAPETAVGNHDYQRKLAEKLVESIGVEEAVQVAQDNQWYGVLVEISYVARWVD